MNLTEWITSEDLSIKEFAEVFTDVVIENFGSHNYKCVRDIVNAKLSERQNNAEPKENPQNEVLHIPVVSNNEAVLIESLRNFIRSKHLSVEWENFLKESEQPKEDEAALGISDVSQQRELLFAYEKTMHELENDVSIYIRVDSYLTHYSKL